MGTQLRRCGMGHTIPTFRPMYIMPNGWMDQDTTWYRGEPRPRRHCVRLDPSSRHGKGHSSFMWFPPYFYSGVSTGASQKSFIAVFAISCTRFRISRLVRSCLTLNDARQRYFGIAEDGQTVANRSIYCIKVEKEVGYFESINAVSAIFLFPVSAYALAGLLLSPFCNLWRQTSHLSTVIWSHLTLNDVR